MIRQFKLDAVGSGLPSSTTAIRSAKRRHLQALFVLATLIAASVAGCSVPGTDGPRDVGNMAFPAPLPQGNLDTVTLSGRQPRDVGNMAYPEPLPQGNLATSRPLGRQPQDTGNMAYPAPSPIGTVATTTIR